MKNRLIFGFVFFILAVGVSAVEVSDTLFNSTGLGTSVNVTYPVWLDASVVDAGFITFDGLRSSASESEKLWFNITETNALYFGFDLPNITSSTTTTKVINSSLDEMVNVSVLLDAECKSTTPQEGDLSTITYSSATGAYDLSLNYYEVTCSSNTIRLDGVGVESGLNTFTLTYASIAGGSCNTMLTNITRLGSIFGLMVLAAIVGLGVTYYNSRRVDPDIVIGTLGFAIVISMCILALNIICPLF